MAERLCRFCGAPDAHRVRVSIAGSSVVGTACRACAWRLLDTVFPAAEPGAAPPTPETTDA